MLLRIFDNMSCFGSIESLTNLKCQDFKDLKDNVKAKYVMIYILYQRLLTVKL